MPPLENTFRVAIFDEFLDAFAKIPKAQQKKVNKFIRLFRENPTASAINYESIAAFSDQNLKTVRIDQAYRAIVLKPEKGNVHVLLWVDHHDAAMAWAKNKRVTIHPETGSLQVLRMDAVEVSAPEPAEADAPLLYEGIRDRELRRLGVPEELIAKVRELRTPDQLDALQEALPDEAYEALFFLAEGETLEEVEQALASTPAENVDTTDFEAALDRDSSKRRFVVVTSDEALEAMLDAPMEKWRIFLHPSQRQLVYRSWKGPVRVLGGAGTGKTVVAMHRAAYLVEQVFTSADDRLLFTTFTRNLAADIKANLQTLCSSKAMRRIEVIHLDKWVAGLLRRSGYDYEIAYWPGDPRLKKAWGNSTALAPSGWFVPEFYRDEWELVVQAQGCEQEQDYVRASRAGRGTRLTRKQRKEIWPVFEEYRHQLDRQNLREPEDALRDAAALLANQYVRVNYRSVIVDEAQDMSTNAFVLLRQIIPEEQPDDLFICGDGHQRLYRRKVVLQRAGINIRGRRGRKLRINYRTTEEIRRFAVNLLEGVVYDDLDGGDDTTKGYTSLMHGDPPKVKVFSAFEEEVSAIVEWVRGGPVERTCLVARTKALRDKYEAAVSKAGIETYRVKRSAPEDVSAPGLRVATMHRVKGLEYGRVVIAGASDDNVPWKKLLARSEDAAVRDDLLERERALLYVASTRAKKAVLITVHGKPSEWLGEAKR
ncbi:UvrD-helicase domain-containing protein [Myxococcota bacterium]